MGLRWHGTTVEAVDPARLARWWAEVLRYQIMFERRDIVGIGCEAHRHPYLIFVGVGMVDPGRNRLHIELDCDDLPADIERLLDMGARPAETGRARPASGVALADPEGNEFVLTRLVRRDGTARE